MKIATVLGARPQFIKAAPVSREISLDPALREVIIHTGQHYDYNMSKCFFDDLGIPEPVCNLEVGSASHGRQTGEMVIGIERVLMEERPDLVLVYGDTNSTLAGALVAVKLHVPIAHVEAGLRSFNRRMPEESNRVVTDHLSDLLFCPTDKSVANLARESVFGRVHLVGDVMRDCYSFFRDRAQEHSTVLEDLGLQELGSTEPYCLATIHRPENTDDPARMDAILQGLSQVGTQVIIPLHPRTRAYLEKQGSRIGPNIRTVQPLAYFDMLILEANAEVILTDSGGIQKEAFFAGVPCVTMRDETEWVELVEGGYNTLTGADPGRIVRAVESSKERVLDFGVDIYGQGDSAVKIVETIRRVDLSE
ncbi:MAG: UDP-N-acetylglucosamine 2-epimerase (non-hydrolyzing) [Acidobacteria bacterium]|nr:UDP-N-acetylglucosamine 2-epimerase (non-hydrolyzing) [Acidobacteriota bacterium]